MDSTQVIDNAETVENVERDEEDPPESHVEEERVHCGRNCKTCIGCICKRFKLACTEDCLCPSATCKNKEKRNTLNEWINSSDDIFEQDYKDEYLYGETKTTFSTELDVFLELLENNGILNHIKVDTNRYKRFKCSKGAELTKSPSNRYHKRINSNTDTATEIFTESSIEA